MPFAFTPCILTRASFKKPPLLATRRPRTSHRLPSMSGKRKGKGFDNTPSPKVPDKSETNSTKRPGDKNQFTPRGPTLRAEYEKKGLIEPTLGPNSGVLPEVVADRMLRRILTFAGIPFTLLFSFFAAYFVLKYKYDITVIPVVVAYSTLGTIFLATLGISYGIFSSSWDEADEGSTLGWTEATTNLVRAKDGLFGARQKELQEEAFALIDRREEEKKNKEEQNHDD